MTNASPGPDRTAPAATPPETPHTHVERGQATAAAVRASHEVQTVEDCGSSAKAIRLVLGLRGWRTVEDLAFTGYERSAAIRWALSPNGRLCAHATRSDVLVGLEQAVRSTTREGRDFREGALP